MISRTIIQNDVTELWLDIPYTIKEHNGDIFVLNSYHRFVKFNQQGKPLKKWRTFADTREGGWDCYPQDFVVNQKGEVLLLDTHANIVVIFDHDGEEINHWGAGFNRPCRIALDKEDHVFILDQRNNRVLQYDVDGNFLAEWGIGKEASDLAVLPDGSFWVTYGERISFYNANTLSFQDWELSVSIKYINVDSNGTLFGLDWEGIYEFNGEDMVHRFECSVSPDWSHGNPFAIDSNNHFLITNGMSNIVAALDKEGEVVAEYGQEPHAYKLVHPFGVAVSRDHIFVSDIHQRNVLVFDKEGNFKNSWGAAAKIKFDFFPSGIMYHDGVLYVVSRNCVFKFNERGECVGQFGEEGDAPGQFNNARSIACDGEGFLYVADKGNKRVQKLTRDGEYVLHWSTEGLKIDEFDTPEDVAVDKENTVYVLDTRGAVVMFTKEGEVLRAAANSLAVSQPQSIAIGELGNFFVAENYGVKQFEYEGIIWDELGGYGSGESEFHSVSRMTVSDGLLYIADTMNKRVQVAKVVYYPGG